MIDGVTRRGSSPVFVGRRRELDRLEEAYARAAGGQPSLVLVAGDAGVGKTRFVAEFGTGVEASGGRTVTGGCLDLGEGGIPYAPFVEAFGGLARTLAPDEREAAFGPWADALSVLISGSAHRATSSPQSSSAGDDADPTARRARLFDAVIGVLGHLAADRPMALLIEDIHWADGSTRDLLRFIVRNLRTERSMLVATIRTDDLHRRHPLMPLLSELERTERTERIDLQPFGRDEIALQFEGILGAPPSDAVADALARRSDGLPFYVEELLAADSGDTGAIPTTLRDILGMRLASLSEQAMTVVGAAAAVGPVAEVDRLSAAAAVDPDAIEAGLREAVEARILVPPVDHRVSAYRFRHALLREAAYDELLPPQRIRLHSRVADLLTTRLAADPDPDPSDLADLAVHADLAGDQPRALAGSVRALRAFAVATAFREALAHAERALGLWPRVPDAESTAGISHAELLALAASVAADAGEPRRAVGLFRSALAAFGDTIDLERRLTMMADLWVVTWEAYDFAAATALSDEMAAGVAGLPPSSLASRVWTEIGSDRWSGGSIRGSLEPYEVAMRIAEEVGDDRSWVIAASLLAHSLTDLGRSGRADALMRQVMAMSPRYDGTIWPFWAAVDREMALWGSGHFDEALQVLDETLATARRYGVDERIGSWLTGADPLFELGRLDEVEELNRRIGGSALADHPMLGTAYIVIKARVVRGEFDAVPDLDQERRFPAPGARAWDLEVLTMLARAQGQFDRVRELVAEAQVVAGDGQRDGVMWLLFGWAIGAAADEAVRLRGRRRPDDAVEAVRLGHSWYDALRTIVDAARADGGAGAFCEATYTTTTAELSRLDAQDRPDLWASAVDQWDAMGQRERGAYSRLRWAESILATDGDRSVAAAALRESHATAIDLRAAPLAAEIESLSARSKMDLDERAPTAPSETAGPASGPLTARERDVLRLVTAGHTNREIGERLFISEKTVSVHVSNAMAKLDALSRYEAAANAERLGLL